MARIIDIGWSERRGFPQYTPDNSSQIDVLVIISEELRDQWPMIDQFEGTAYYERVPISYKLENGTFSMGSIYQVVS